MAQTTDRMRTATQPTGRVPFVVQAAEEAAVRRSVDSQFPAVAAFLADEQAREHDEPTASAPVTFEAVSYRLLEAGGDLEELSDKHPDDIRLKAALTALEYASRVVEAYAEAEASE